MPRGSSQLSEEERLRRKEKQLGLSAELADAQAEYLERAERIATDYGRNIAWVRGMLHIGGKHAKKRSVNTWTAFLSRWLKQYNADKEKGQKLSIAQLLDTQRAALQEEYNALDADALEALKEEGARNRAETENATPSGTRRSQKSIQRDFEETFGEIIEDINIARQRIECDTILIAVRSDPNHPAAHPVPQIFVTPNAETWLLEAFQLTPDQLARNLQSATGCCGHINGGVASSSASAHPPSLPDAGHNNTGILPPPPSQQISVGPPPPQFDNPGPAPNMFGPNLVLGTIQQTEGGGQQFIPMNFSQFTFPAVLPPMSVAPSGHLHSTPQWSSPAPSPPSSPAYEPITSTKSPQHPATPADAIDPALTETVPPLSPPVTSPSTGNVSHPHVPAINTAVAGPSRPPLYSQTPSSSISASQSEQVDSTPISAAPTLSRGASSASRKIFSADVSETRNRIQTGLDDLLFEARKVQPGTVRMNYTNYELKIVERYSVHLANWLTNDGKVVNPGDLRRDQLTELLRSLRDGDCRWEVLTKEELAARIAYNRARQASGETVYTERKKRKRVGGDEGEVREAPCGPPTPADVGAGQGTFAAPAESQS
ncbi:hypothetical protein OF83DRAFT_1111475 [Amylostereum chailletii]|nr:hypothetical protein OF83DRAFT_1111475 [Amylostereum chailletii]